MQNFVSKKLSWFMIFILTFMWSGIFEYKAFAQQRTEPSAEELKQMAGKLKSLFEALEETLERLHRDSFDPEAIIEKVGNDPLKLFEWVRDNTYLVPYRGSLRGPIGVLMDRLGNSLDRSLLLYKLLHLAGHEVRLVRGSLSKETSKKLLLNAGANLYRNSFSSPSLLPKTMDDLIEKFIARYQLDHNEFSEVTEKMILENEQMTKKVIERTKEQTTSILASLEKSKANLKLSTHDIELSKLRDHWWVQWQNEDTWRHMDSSLPNLKLDEAMGEFKETFDPEDLDEGLLHLVDITIKIERWEDGNLKEETVLEHTLRPSELFEKRVTLNHYPMNWPEDLNLLKDEDPVQRLKNILVEQKEWLPVLDIGQEKITDSSFKDSGETNDTPGKKSKSRGAGGIRGGLLRTLAGREDEKKESELTAEWIEYNIRIPGEKDLVIRREIFDLVGPAARASDDVLKPQISEEERFSRNLILLKETEILIQVSQISPDFISYLMAKNMLANKNFLFELLDRDEKIIHEDHFKQINKLTPVPGPEYSLAFLRHNMSEHENHVFHNRPNVLNFHRGIKKISKGKLISFSGLDIVYNDVAVGSGLDADPFQIRLMQGVLDTNIEASLLGNSGKIPINTSEIFAIAQKEGIECLTINDISDSTWNKAKLTKDLRERIKQDIDEGYVIIIPEKPVDIEGKDVIGWWRINPETGYTLGLGQDGTGQSMIEYAAAVIATGGSLISCVISASSIKNAFLRFLNYLMCSLIPGYGFVGIVALGSQAGMVLFSVIVIAIISITVSSVASAYSS